MNKKAFFFSVELYYKEQNVVCNFKKIPDLLKEIIDTNGIVNDGITTLDLTGVAESLHTMLDVYRYKDNYFFARASKQRPTGTVIGRDYDTKVAESVLPGYSEDEKGIELYTYIYVNYEACVLQIISAQGAPNENIVVDLFKMHSDEYNIKLIAIPNANGVQKFYGKEGASISSITLELPNPDPAILENVLGENGNNILRSATNDHISVSLDIKSSISRHLLTTDTEESNGIIDAIQDIIARFGTTRFKKASIKGKAQNIKAREYNFYEENYFYPVDIPAYRMEDKKRVYYNQAELAQINYENMVFSYNESRDFILPLIGR